MTKDTERQINWAALPPIATIARLFCRELMLENGYLRVGNRIPNANAYAERWGRSITEECLRDLIPNQNAKSGPCLGLLPSVPQRSAATSKGLATGYQRVWPKAKPAQLGRNYLPDSHFHIVAPSSSGLGSEILSLVTWVRIPVGSPSLVLEQFQPVSSR